MCRHHFQPRENELCHVGAAPFTVRSTPNSKWSSPLETYRLHSVTLIQQRRRKKKLQT